MPGLDFERLKQLATLTPEQIGEREEEVKINFAVPLLEALGHSRLRFEHRANDVLLHNGLSPFLDVIKLLRRLGQPPAAAVEIAPKYWKRVLRLYGQPARHTK
ncbi:MAG TPA: hypothetical protein PLE19_15330 [Planctomycetota bacterium]|nr:hypothetical protein [Planctomycetota bacterium]HRR82502.1 hypothetical protein [Planctomycetota bacterium]HRT97663.1 hypothetical protein [Planctomycetota bacterium]